MPRSRPTTRLCAGSMVAGASRGGGRVIVAVFRSGEVLTRSGPMPVKSTSASAWPVAKSVVRSPLITDGTHGVSFSRSTSTWKVPVAAWYSAMSSRATIRAPWLWSTVCCSNMPGPGSAPATWKPIGMATATAAAAAASFHTERPLRGGAGSSVVSDSRSCRAMAGPSPWSAGPGHAGCSKRTAGYPIGPQAMPGWSRRRSGGFFGGRRRPQVVDGADHAHDQGDRGEPEPAGDGGQRADRHREHRAHEPLDDRARAQGAPVRGVPEQERRRTAAEQPRVRVPAEVVDRVRDTGRDQDDPDDHHHVPDRERDERDDRSPLARGRGERVDRALLVAVEVDPPDPGGQRDAQRRPADQHRIDRLAGGADADRHDRLAQHQQDDQAVPLDEVV